jgi:tetratricopeptide (TPR) repeat protein
LKMISPRTIFLLLLALLIFCFGLAANLQPQFWDLEKQNHQSNNFFAQLLGDSSRIFANSFATKADAYYHSGYYPTIFDNNEAFKTLHMAEDTGAVASRNQGDETSFMGPPRDWIDAFGRHFIPNRHTHLDEGGPTDDLSKSDEVREILPWLKLSAELDPQNIQTILATSFFLRTKMNKVSDAEDVLREALRNNPDNPQLLFELGRIRFENYDDMLRARNIWEAGLRSLQKQIAGKKKDELDFDDRFLFEQLQTKLAQLEENAGNTSAAVAHWEKVKMVSPNPGEIQKHIDEITQKSSAPASANPAAH